MNSYGGGMTMDDLCTRKKMQGSENSRPSAVVVDALSVLRENALHRSEEMPRQKRESAIKLATDRKRKLDAQRSRDECARRKNGLVFNKDGSFGVVQAAHASAKQREFKGAPNVAANPELADEEKEDGYYSPLHWGCCNSDSCADLLHQHDSARTLTQGLRPLEAYTGTSAEYERKLGLEYRISEEAVAMDADRFASLPVYMKDVMNVLKCYTDVHDTTFRVNARNMHEIEYSEARIVRIVRDDVEALREAMAVLNTSRQSARQQFTESRDIIFGKARKALSFVLACMAQKRILREEGREVYEMMIFRAWYDYLAHRNQNKLVERIKAILKDDVLPAK